MRLVEYGPLDVAHDVAVLADDLGEGNLPDFGELSLAELGGGVVALVPESVALFQLLELDADDAGECGAHQSPLEWGLAQAAGEEVDVLDASVHLWEISAFLIFYHFMF